VLSAVLPCIPVSEENGKYDDEIIHGTGQEGHRTTKFGGALMGRDLMEKTQGQARNRGLVKQKSSGTLLEVKVDRQVKRVID
jgi:hypothetical protein